LNKFFSAIAVLFFVLSMLSIILTNTNRTGLVASVGVITANNLTVALPIVFGLAAVAFAGAAIWSRKQLGHAQARHAITTGKLSVLNANTIDPVAIRTSLVALSLKFASQRAAIGDCISMFDSFDTLVTRLNDFLLANPQVQFESAKDIIDDAHKAICNRLVRMINSGAMFDSINASGDFTTTLGKAHHDIAEWLATVDQLVSVVLDSTSGSGDIGEARKLADYYIQQLKDSIPGSETDQ